MTKQYVRTAPVKDTSKVTVVRSVAHDMQYVLVVDCETTIDIEQRLRVAGYVLYDRSHDDIKEGKIYPNNIKEIGLFYDFLSAKELQLLHSYAKKHGYKVTDRQTFIKERLYPLLLAGVSLANHNIKFDFGTLATSWYFPNKDTIAMRLCDCTGIKGLDPDTKPVSCPLHPSIHAHHLPSGKYLFSIDTSDVVGCILDTMGIGRALLGPGQASLLAMGQKFKCETVKFIAEEHGSTLDERYLDYTINDIKATLELLIKEMKEYNRYGLSKPLGSIVSEAGIGKAMFDYIGVIPFAKQHTNVPIWYEKIAARAYKGGRSEVMCRLTPIEILYCDFKSQYPLVNALLGLQDLLLAKSVMVVHKNAEEITRWLEGLKIEDLAEKQLWKKIRMFVKIKADGDILPVESREEGDSTSTLRNTYVYGVETWYTLCDVLASVVRTGKVPHIVDAVEMVPYGKVPTRSIKFFGETKYMIDPSKQDFFAEVINVRTDVKADMKPHKKVMSKYGNIPEDEKDTIPEYVHADEEHTYLDSLQLALKLIANSTSYGALCETREVEGIDIAGKYATFSIAAHITSGGRLLLALAEALGMQRGLKYVMCDTDSMAFARPEGMDREEFHQLVKEIRDFFVPLSPYKKKADGSNVEIFELEEVNGYNPLSTPLYFIGVSSKRYVCYHKLEDGTFAIRKATVNGVGYVQFDNYEDKYTKKHNFVWPHDIPYPTKGSIYCPTTSLQDYQYLLWYRAIQQLEKGSTEVLLDPTENWCNQIVRHQSGLNTPHTMKIYRYIEGIRPFGFFTMLPNSPDNPHSYYLSGVSTSEEIEKSVVHQLKTNKVVTSPSFKRLYQHFDGYFSHPEAKVVDGEKTGWLEKKRIHVTEISTRYRKGKEASDTPTLFDMLG